jgi:hypothetical protein
MTTPQTDEILRSWIATRDPGPAPATLRASVELATRDIGPAPQARRRWRFSLAVAAAVIVALGGIALIAFLDAGRTKVASPPSPVASPSMESDPVLPSTGRVEPGRYVRSIRGMAVHLTVPDGWSGNGGGVSRGSYGAAGQADFLLWSPDIGSVVTDVCAAPSKVTLEPVERSVQALATALGSQKGVLTSRPIDVRVGGYPAKKLTASLPSSCGTAVDPPLWADQVGVFGFRLEHGQIANVYLVDVNGDRLIITNSYDVEVSPHIASQLGEILDSIAIDARSGASPAPTTEPGGWLAGGSHSITVDDVPFSFDVPPLLSDGGWNLYGTSEITKDTGGSQDAEAMVYWTAYPEGAYARPCTDLGLPQSGSITEVADAISRTPGTTLVAGPAEANIGGRTAAHVVVTVTQDLGCDPKYFFTSAAPGGGPGWWETKVDATISVWLVDIDSTRLFIAAEWKPTARSKLLQEVQDIVASIRFE